jgi:imidazolonepropionase-like amidohydrolase
MTDMSTRAMSVTTRLVMAVLGACVAWSYAVAPRPVQAQGGTTAFTGARIFDGTGRPAIEQGTLVISNGRVQQVGPQASVKIPEGATRVDVSGKTIVPGFINSHGHVAQVKDSPLSLRDQLLTQLRMYANYGVTTVVSLGDDGVESVKLRDEQEQGSLRRARLFPSGPNVVAKTPEEARKGVDQVVDMKVSIIKTRVDGPDNAPARMPPPVYGAIIDQAHKRRMRVAAHLYYLKDARGLLDAGVDVIAHSIRDQDVDQPLLADMKNRNVGYIPTLTRDLSVYVYESTPAFFKDPFFLRGKSLYGQQMAQLSDPALQEKTRQSEEARNIKVAMVQAQKNLKRLSDAGVTIAMGTDTGANLMGRWQGYFEHTELELMVKSGMTPTQVLVAATGDAAKVMNLQQLGTLESGKWADLVVLGANPLTDIRNTQKIESVWIAGQRLAPTSSN